MKSIFFKQIFFVVGLIGFSSTVWAEDNCNPGGGDAGYKLIGQLNSLDSWANVLCKLDESGLQFTGEFSQSFGETQKIVPKRDLFGELGGMPYWAGGARFIIKVSKFPIGQIFCDAEIFMNVNHSNEQMFFLAALVAEGRASSAIIPTKQGDVIVGGYIENIDFNCAVDSQTISDNLVIDFESTNSALSMSPGGAAILSYEQPNGLFSAEYIINYPSMYIEHRPWVHPLTIDAITKFSKLSLREKDYEYNNLEQRKLKNN
ncbi:hypothetical protein N8254_01775 [Pseudomonadales bacterium]|nr:hypothetical protein [Pseudomonadales bacterium]